MHNNNDFTHPQYDEYNTQWAVLSDIFGGEKNIKSKTTEYLPATPGMKKDIEHSKTKKIGEERYERYLFGAIFYNYFIDTLDAMVGLINSNPPDNITLPKSLDYLKTNCTPFGDDIRGLMSDLNIQQLSKGRTGLLLDSTVSGFKMLQYTCENIINWSGSYVDGVYVLDFVLLKEPTLKRDNFVYTEVDNFRLCALDGNGVYYSTIIAEDQIIDFDILNPPEEVIYPLSKGNTSSTIPFMFINSNNITPECSNGPLLNLANICLHIYTSDADYRQYIFGSSQDTLFISGFDADELDVIRIGSGALIASTNDNASASFIGINSAGLSENRLSLENLHKQAAAMGVALLESGNESGKALTIRSQVKTATMRTITQTAAKAIEVLIRIGAQWEGLELDDADIIIHPNSDFSDSTKTIEEIDKLWTSRIPVSNETLHSNLIKTGVTDKTFLQEQKEINNNITNNEE